MTAATPARIAAWRASKPRSLAGAGALNWALGIVAALYPESRSAGFLLSALDPVNLAQEFVGPGADLCRYREICGPRRLARAPADQGHTGSYRDLHCSNSRLLNSGVRLSTPAR